MGRAVAPTHRHGAARPTQQGRTKKKKKKKTWGEGRIGANWFRTFTSVRILPPPSAMPDAVHGNFAWLG